MMIIPDNAGKQKNVPGFIFVNSIKFAHLTAVLYRLQSRLANVCYPC